MTKKKLVAFISLAFAVIMIITSVMLFFAYMPSVDFRLTYDRVNNGIDYELSRYAKENKTAEKVEENLDELFSNISYATNIHFPMMYALIDPDTGEIVRQSSSYISFQKSIDDEWNYLNIDPYLTPEIKKQIVDYRDNVKAGMFYIYRMSFNTSSGEYIPVEMDIGFYDLYEKETIKFTDLTPDLEINEETEFKLFNYVFRIFCCTCNNRHWVNFLNIYNHFSAFFKIRHCSICFKFFKSDNYIRLTFFYNRFVHIFTIAHKCNHTAAALCHTVNF